MPTALLFSSLNNLAVHIWPPDTDVAHAECLNFLAVECHAAIKHNFAMWKLAKVKRLVGPMIRLKDNSAELLPCFVGTRFIASVGTRFIASVRNIAFSTQFCLFKQRVINIHACPMSQERILEQARTGEGSLTHIAAIGYAQHKDSPPG